MKQHNQTASYQTITHTFAPIYDEQSSILILGSLPSVKSRENQFYYGHPQNRFWAVLAQLFQCQVPQTISEKKEMLLANHVAIWDVIRQCDIIGSSDSSIKNVIANDMNVILEHANIKTIYANGNKAFELYKKHCYPIYKREIVKLPSTSPANASYQLPKLTEAWRVILSEGLEK